MSNQEGRLVNAHFIYFKREKCRYWGAHCTRLIQLYLTIRSTIFNWTFSSPSHTHSHTHNVSYWAPARNTNTPGADVSWQQTAQFHKVLEAEYPCCSPSGIKRVRWLIKQHCYYSIFTFLSSYLVKIFHLFIFYVYKTFEIACDHLLLPADL